MNDETTNEEVKAPKIELTEKNGVKQPRDGSKTRAVWDIADELSRAKKAPALRGEVMEAGLAKGLSKGTVATQYGKWCTFHGVTPADKKVEKVAEPAE
jgi:hypothetical protein